MPPKQQPTALAQVATGTNRPTTSASLNIPPSELAPKPVAVKMVSPEDVYDGLYGVEKFQNYILKPSHLKRVWASSNLKDEIFSIYQEYFKPKSSLEPERVEYNELNIFSEFQVYNLIFAKNELMLDDHKASIILNLFWRLLEFNSEPPVQDKEERPKSNNNVRINTTSTINRTQSNKMQLQQIQPPQPVQDPEIQFANLLSHKFELFRTLLFATLSELTLSLRLSGEEVRRIADYAKLSYFKHLRLYDYALNNKQLCEVKRITINENAPIIAANLNEALILGAEEAISYEEEAETLCNEVRIKANQRNMSEVKRQKVQERRAQGLPDEEDSEDPTLKDEQLKMITDERIRKAHIEKDVKIIIHQQVTGFEGNLTKTIDERGKQLDEKVTGGAAAGAPKKK